MSLLDDASLVLVPSGYKSGKVYSVKPTNGDGDLSFTRSNDTATRVNSAGLIEKVRTNLFVRSEEFENASWGKVRATITANATTDPLGDSTADKLVTDTSPSTDHYMRQFTNYTAGTSYTASIYAKAGEYNSIFLFANNASKQAFYNLSTGVISGLSSGASATITNVGSGWYRCTLTFVSGSSISDVMVYTIANNSSTIISGDGTSGIFVWGAQLETGNIATDYIPTTTTAVSVGMTANVPRVDYSGGGCPSLLLEPQRTNLNDQSEYFNGWSKANATVTDNAIISPEGVQNGSLVECTSGRIQKNISLTSGTTYVISLFAKANGDYFTVQVLDGTNPATQFNLSTESTSDSNGATSTIEEFGNGWYRCTMKFTSAYTGATTIRGITSTDTNGVYVYGWQLEAGSYVSSYIPTYGAVVTRGADACSKAGISSLIGQTEGTLFVEASTLENGANNRITISDNTINNRVSIEWDTDADTIKGFIGVGGNVETTSHDQTNQNKIALLYTTSVAKLFINGSLIDTDSTSIPTMSGMNRIDFSNYGDSVPFFGNAKQVIYFPTALTDAECIELTTI